MYSAKNAERATSLIMVGYFMSQFQSVTQIIYRKYLTGICLGRIVVCQIHGMVEFYDVETVDIFYSEPVKIQKIFLIPMGRT